MLRKQRPAMKIGYARVSTTEQNLDAQMEALKAAGCEKIFTEKKSGTKLDGRTALAEALEFAREGDTLVVTRVDRLARSMGDLQIIVGNLRKQGVILQCTEQPVDTSTAAGKAFFDMLGVFAEFETNLRRERQLEGISAAKERGVYQGRKRSVDRSEVLRRLKEGETPSAVAAAMNVSRMTVHRISKEAT